MTMICMAALLVMAMSCKKEKVENTAVGAGFRATLEAHAGDSKTHLEEGTKVKWDAGDAVKVVNADNVVKTFKIGAIHGDYADLVPAEGQEVTDDFYKPNYKAYYPATISDAGQVSLPQTQDYAAGSFGKGFNPMAAYAVNKNLDFKNLCGLLALQLTGDCKVKSITITSKKDEMLWGKGELTLSSSAATLGTLTEGGNSITLNCYVDNEYVQLSGTATTFYFVVPDGALAGGFDVLLTDSDDKVWRRSASQNTTINQNKIRTMSELAVETHEPVRPSTVTLTAGCSDEFIYNVGGSITVPEGTHTCEFGLVYSATNAEPTLDNGTKVVAGTATFSGTKTFSADITGLTVGTTYHVRAYAMIEGAAYSTAKDIAGGNVPLPMTWTNGKSPLTFTVSDNDTPDDATDDIKVYFSQGNLQYTTTGTHSVAGGGTAPGTWRFAEHQFELIGAANANASSTYEGWIDLFGWGTSGYNNKYPYMTSTTSSAYGNGLNNISDTDYDWGVYNAISNGGSNSWRTLTKDEWVYLINTRKDGSGKLLYGEGKVGRCTSGLIILPDDWSCPSGLTDVVRGASSWSNVYSYSEWSQMEAAGAVFLPAAGYRSGTSLSGVGYGGYYWSSSYGNSNCAYFLSFNSGNVNPIRNDGRFGGFSVRLVSEN